MKKTGLFLLTICQCIIAKAQQDSIFHETHLPLKINHAEPVYIDMIRDLGARKGEKELNLGWQMNQKTNYMEQGGFIEYEFSPLNRLGLEVEIPFNYYYTDLSKNSEPLPNEKIEGIKLAAQYTFLVSPKYQASMAFGTIYELELHSYKTFSRNKQALIGNDLNPFLIVAKRFGQNFHTLIYTGPVFHREFQSTEHYVEYQINLSAHYILPHTKNFIGIEINQEIIQDKPETIIRPQIKLKLAQGIALGLATGIPTQPKNSGLSFIARLIYEPKTK